MAGMRAVLIIAVLVIAALAGARIVQAKHHHHHDDEAAPGLANVTLLIVRHAEKPASDDDSGLAPAGVARAKAYANYFQHFSVDGEPVKIDTLIASSDSEKSARPRLTLEPLSQATGIAIQHPFSNHETKEAARWIAEGQAKHAALIAWHHGKIDQLLKDLGADPDDLLPGGDWPDNVYDWVIVLRYDDEGRLASEKRIVEPADLK